MSFTSPSQDTPPRQTMSLARILLFSFLVSFFVLLCTLVLQWVVYDDWMHQTGPMHLVGSAVAAVLTFAFLLRWQFAMRRQQLEMLHRFQTIAEMNDRIRNALQIIACTTYVADPEATEHVRQAVDAIDSALDGVIAEARPLPPGPPQGKGAAASQTSSKEPRRA